MKRNVYKRLVLSVAAVAILFVAELQRLPAIQWQFNVPVRMRDGVTLAANVYLPATEGKYPVILIRTPYGKAGNQEDGTYFAKRGYAVVVQDTRGRFESDGEWYAFRHESDDGAQTIEWAARQSWSNGKVVTHGGSYLAIDQWLAATRASSHLAAMVSLIGPSDLYANTLHNGGSFQYGTALTWAMGTGRRTRLLDEMKLIRWPQILMHLPVEAAAAAGGFEPRFYRDWVEHSARDAYWQALSWREVYPRLAIPIFHAGGWFDIFQGGTIENFLGVAQQAPTGARSGQRIVMGPWAHGAFGPKVGEVDFGAQSVIDLRGKLLRWLDHYVKGVQNGADQDAPVEVFFMGVNQWRVEKTWPPEGFQPTRFFLHSRGKANTSEGDGLLSLDAPEQEPPDRYDYDPANPVPTHGSGTCCMPELMPWGPMDQRSIEKRDDVLAYTSVPLERDAEVAGPVIVHLFASTSARDTDWTAKLVDLAPDGFAMNLTDGIRRARFRNSLEHPELLTPDKVYEFVIDAENTAHVFLKGHRIRLEVSSSSFPRFSRNTNTGRHPEKDTSFVVAHQTVYHDSPRRSDVALHVRGKP